jgi:hypothetical protein
MADPLTLRVGKWQRAAFLAPGLLPALPPWMLQDIINTQKPGSTLALPGVFALSAAVAGESANHKLKRFGQGLPQRGWECNHREQVPSKAKGGNFSSMQEESRTHLGVLIRGSEFHALV